MRISLTLAPLYEFEVGTSNNPPITLQLLQVIKGDNGESAYEVAVEAGFVGDQQAWLESLVGADGLSAYELAVEGGFVGTEQEWIESLIGSDGLSAYEIAVNEGFVGTIEEWLASLQGEDGDPASNLVESVNGYQGIVVLEASDVGADAAGTASSEVSNHEEAADPHEQYVLESEIGVSVASLSGGVIPTSQIPAIAITEFLSPPPANQAAMLALAGQKGDWTIRTDKSTVYVITGDDPTLLANWTEMAYPTAPVSSVNGQTGVVVLAKGDVGLANVDNTSDANKPVSTATAIELALKATIDSPSFTTVANFLTGSNQSRITSDANGPVLAGVNASTYLTVQSFQGIGSYLKLNGYSGIDVFNNTTHLMRLLANEMGLGATSKISWGTGIGLTTDASIRRNASGILAQREGTTAQSFYQYNTWTDAANNEFGGLRWTTNRFELFTDKLGSGSYRDLWILAGNPVGHRLKVSGAIIQDYYGGIADARAGMNLDSSFNIFARAGGVTRISSANSSMTGQATLELCSNTNTVTTQIIRPNVKDGNGGYTGAGHHLSVYGGKGAAGNNAGGNYDLGGGEKTGTGLPGNIRYGVAQGSLIPGAVMTTGMTDGFFQLPGAAGAPSGTPLNTTGFPMYWDSTNLKIYVYSAGAWKSTAALS